MKMGKSDAGMNNIEKQYQTSENLNTRISIHEKYSTNPQPFGDWIMSHYEIKPGDRILELGCGTGDMWKGRKTLLDGGVHLTLTDFSSGMLETAKKNTAGFPCVDYQVADIQNIPYEDNTFDMVIANMMLYHVPDLDRGLSEVRRVLRPEGSFYCATYGEHGIMEFINETLQEYHISGSIGKSFTLQNGGDLLAKHFSTVERLTREDGLAITCISDFVDYVLSMSSLTGMENADAEILTQAFEKKRVNGTLFVPKEYGMFICKC